MKLNQPNNIETKDTNLNNNNHKANYSDIQSSTAILRGDIDQNTAAFEAEQALNDYLNQIKSPSSNIEKKNLTHHIEKKETPESKKMSTHGSKCYEILSNGMQIGIEHKFDKDIKISFANFQQSTHLFSQQELTNVGPNSNMTGPDNRTIKDMGISGYYVDKNQKSQLCLIGVGPLYEPNGDVTGLGFDNGIKVGQDENISDLQKPGRGTGIAVISGGIIHFSHASEMSEQELSSRKTKKADIFSVPSIKRNGNINTSDNLFDDNPNRYICLNSDGTISLLILSGSISEKRKTLADNAYSRVLYLDSGLPPLNKTVIFNENGESSIYDNVDTKKQSSAEPGGKTPNILLFYK